MHVAQGNGERPSQASTARTPSRPEKRRVHRTSLSRAGPAPGGRPCRRPAGSGAFSPERPRRRRGRRRGGCGRSAAPAPGPGARPAAARRRGAGPAQGRQVRTRPRTGVRGRRAGTRAPGRWPGQVRAEESPSGGRKRTGALARRATPTALPQLAGAPSPARGPPTLHLHSQWPRPRAGASWPAGGGAERRLRPLAARSWSFRLAAEPAPLLRMRGRSPPALRSAPRFPRRRGPAGRAREGAGSRGEGAGGGRKSGRRDTEGGRRGEKRDGQPGSGFAAGSVCAEEHDSRWKKNFSFHL